MISLPFVNRDDDDDPSRRRGHSTDRALVDRRNDDLLSRELSGLVEDRIKAYLARAVRRYIEGPGDVEGMEPEPALRQAHRQAWWNIRRLYLSDDIRYERIFDPLFTPGSSDFGRPNLPWLLLLFALTVCGLVCYGLARYLVLPIRELRAGYGGWPRATCRNDGTTALGEMTWACWSVMWRRWQRASATSLP